METITISKTEYDALRDRAEKISGSSCGEETMTIPRAEYEKLLQLEQKYTALSKQMEWMMEQMRLMNKRAFGASSEKSKESAYEQLTLFFNEVESQMADVHSKGKTTSVAGYTRKKRPGTAGEVLPEGIPEEVVEHGLSEEERLCPACGTEMEPIGKEERLELKFVPAQAILVRHIYYTYACMNCKENDIETPILKTPRAAQVLAGSYATPEAIAHIMVQKYVMGAPLYRQEQDWNRSGVQISRQTMSNWVLAAQEAWLKPLYEALHRKLLERQVLHADETTLQVLHEDGKKAQTKSYMWMYRTGGDAEHPIVLYEYQPSRGSGHPKAFLKGFHGYLQVDGYSGYHALEPEIRLVGCWAHARRKFDEALNALPEKDREGSAALEGQQYCTKLFAIERELAGLTPEERYEQRLKQEKPVLDALSSWVQSKSAAPKSALGKALYYLKEQWPYLMRYLEDGRLELSNNRGERSIKPFVIGRKNFLFANTPHGAQGSATIYSIVETAKENGLDPFRYLTYIFSKAPELSRATLNWAEQFVPEAVPVFCKSR